MNDERLAQRAAAGDRAAFEAIFRRYHQDLYRFCLATTGNPQDAQDALQNTMVKVIKALPGEEREIKLKPWLYRIARNEAVEMVRRRRDNGELQPEQTAASWEIAETAEARERLRALLADLAELPDRQRAALVLRELSGLGFAEIGETFGTTPAVARQTLYEARLSLQQMEAGREMTCETVMRALSDGDGRVTRRRDVRAHLRDCALCRSFRDGIAERHGELAAIAPLPGILAATMLQGLVGSQASVAAGAGAAGIAAGAGKTIATSAIVKSAATVAVAATVGVSVADRGGVIDLPVGGRDGATVRDESKPALGAATDERGESVPATAPGSADSLKQKDGGHARGARNEDNTGLEQSAKGAKAGSVPVGEPRSSRPGTADERSGRGKSSAATPGPPQGLPSASSHGQQTAAAHKPPQAQASPGRSDESGGKPGKAGSAPSSKAQGPPAALSSPEPTFPKPPAATNGKGESQGTGATPVEAVEP